MDDKIWGILVKGYSEGYDGLKMYLWATEEQYQDIMAMLQDETKRDAWVTLGDTPFQIKKIEGFKKMSLKYARTLPSFQKYILERIDEEKRLGIGNWGNPALKENPEGMKRLEDLKAKLKLGKGSE